MDVIDLDSERRQTLLAPPPPRAIDESLSRKIRAAGFIFIVLVVFIHGRTVERTAPQSPSLAWVIESYVDDGLASIAVPFFFIISGFLFFSTFRFEAGQILSKYRSRLRSLLMPYLLWSGFGIALFYLGQSLTLTRSWFTNPDTALLDMAWHRIVYRWLIDPITYPLWFLRDLMVIVLIHPIIYTLVRRTGALALAALATAWLANLQFPRLPHTQIPVVHVETLMWFVFGAYVAIHRPHGPTKRSSWHGLMVTAWLILIAVAVLADARQWRSAILLSKAMIVCGVPTFWLAIDRLEPLLRRRWAIWATHLTFFVYATHEPLLMLLKKGCLHALPAGQSAQLICFVCCPVLVIGIGLLVGAVLRRHAPTMYRILTGGR